MGFDTTRGTHEGRGRNRLPRMKRDVSQLVFFALLSIGLLGVTFGIGLYSGARQTTLFHAVNGVKVRIENAFATLSGEAPILAGTHPARHLQPSRYEGSGITVNTAASQSDLILLSGFFTDTNELRLIRRSGDVVARWPVRYSELFPNAGEFRDGVVPATDWNIDIHGALALPDGSVVFNFEYGGLVKLDRCGNAQWTVRRPTHHSVERSEGGGFLVLGRRFVKQNPSPYPPFQVPFEEDTVLRISDRGEIISELSIPKAFYDSGLQALLTATGGRFTKGMTWDEEVFHVNKVAELPRSLASDFPLFAAGDLVLSIRDLNMLLVVDRNVEKIKWWRIGPWQRQHDPEFKRGGTIVLFNNNAHETVLEGGERSPSSAPRVSNVMEVNPASGESRVLYGGTTGQELSSILRGKVDVTGDGGLVITEFEGGRVLETDARGDVVWQYLNRYSSEEVAELTEGRVYPAGYFTVEDWPCPGGQ